MAAVPQVTQHPASVDAYIRHGWSLVPIPPGSKGPRTTGWNRKEAALKSQSDLPPGWGIGLAHAYSGTMALDIDDYATSKTLLALHGIDLDALFAAPDAVAIDSSNPGHGKLIFAMPFGLVLPSHQVWVERTAIYNLRCGTVNGATTQDVLPPSIHPGTGQPYRWSGAGDWQRLPTLPFPLLVLWQALLEQPTMSAKEPAGDVDWNEVRAAVETIDPDCSRADWIAVGMALHRESPDAGIQVWDAWSSRGTKYKGQREIQQQWRSFRDDKTTSVTMGTVYKLAHDAGWRPSTPDVAALFKPITVDPGNLRSVLRQPPPPMNFDLWPPVLRERALKVAQSTSCDPLVPLWAGLAAAAGAIDAQSRLELMPGWQVPPILWLCTIGDPAQRKTPGSQPMKRALVDLEQEDRPRYAKAMLDWEMQQAIWATDHKEGLDWAKSEDRKLGGEAPQLREEPGKPVPLRIVVSDITSQKLVRICAGLPRGLLCWLDEMNSWCNKLTDPRSGELRSTWTEAYEGNEYTLDRVGDGSITAINFALSIYGNIQPTVYRQHIKSLGADGFIQRFVPAVLGSKQRQLNEPMPDEVSGRVEWDNAVRCVHALPKLVYTLSPGAFAAWREFQRWHLQRQWDDTVLGKGAIYQTAMGKLDGTVARFAFIMHVLENPFSTVVSEDTVRRAIEIGKTYITPVLRYVYSELAGQNPIEAWVADYLVQYSDQNTMTLSQIKRSARRQLEDHPSPWVQDQMILAAMLPLEEGGWVTRTDDGTQEQRHHAQWAINPALATMFADYRRSVIEAKQRDLDMIYKGGHPRQIKAHGAE